MTDQESSPPKSSTRMISCRSASATSAVRQAPIQLRQDRRGPIDGDDRGDLQRGTRRRRQAEGAAVIRADVEIEGSIRHAADSISPVRRSHRPEGRARLVLRRPAGAPPPGLQPLTIGSRCHRDGRRYSPARVCRASDHPGRRSRLAVDRPRAADRRGLPAVRHLGGRALRRAARRRRAGRRDPRRRAGVRSAGPDRLVGGDRVRRTELVHAGGGRLRDRDRAGRRPARRRRGDDRRAAESSGDADDSHRRRPARHRSGTSSCRSSAARCSSSPWRCSTARRWRQSPRDGVQPLEFMDEAYYSVLGADLAKTGTESHLFAVRLRRHPRPADPDLVPLGRGCGSAQPRSRSSARSRSTPATSSSCPLLLLAAAALTGTLVRRMTGSTSRGALPVRVRRPACSCAVRRRLRASA